MKVHIKPVNMCMRRQLGLQKLKAYLSRNNHTLTVAPEDADAVLLMACAFNNKTEEDGIHAYNELRKLNTPIFLLEGIAETQGSTLSAEDHFGLSEFSRLDRHFCTAVPYDQVEDQNAMFSDPEDKMFHIQISRGCADNCSYCGDKIIVKDLVSKSADRCIAEVLKGISEGYGNFELLGDDVGAWGLDINTNICELLDSLCSMNEVRNLSIQEVNIKYLIKYISAFEQILKYRKIRSMVVAFQSGSSRILEAMRRGYNREEVDKLLGILWKYGVAARFHAIIGFPGETEDEFLETMDVICKNPFASGSVFVYQCRSHTPASRLPGRLSEFQIQQRKERAIGILAERNGRLPQILPDKLMM
jgi:tRNA A37 methylthiotransferase MiaB